MGNEHSTGSSDGSDEPEAHQVGMEGDVAEQPARKASSDMGNEMVKVHSDDDGSASPVVPPEEEATCFSLPVEETGAEELQENSQEGGQSPSLSQSASLDKGQPTGQTRELEIAKPPVEHSSEKAEYTTSQIAPEAADDAKAEAGVILLTSEGHSVNAELQKTAGSLCCLAETTVQKKPSEIITWSPTEKEQASEKQTAVQSKSEYGGFEMLAEPQPERAASGTAEGHSSVTTALGSKPLEAESSATAELMITEMAPLSNAEAQAGQNEDSSEVDSQTTEEAEDHTASGIPKEADSDSALAQRVLDTPEKPPASNVVKHAADTKFADDIQNDGGYLTTEAMSLVKEHPAAAAMQNLEAEPLPDHLAESSSIALQELGEAKEPALMKEMDGACSDPAAIEMAEAWITKLDEHPQPVHISCTDVKLVPVVQETELAATADVEAQIQGSPGAQKDSTEGQVHMQKQETKFPKTFYLCCSKCNAGEGENSEQ